MRRTEIVVNRANLTGNETQPLSFLLIIIIIIIIIVIIITIIIIIKIIMIYSLTRPLQYCQSFKKI